ncbi:MAG: biotin--[acetyl-CoA-carboxylase] ligase [Proteobacteria bacterium]|nr:biotin--[acetyl-CoA-carboxylase] ligase [Pseudomonadota bacterium]
MADTLKSEQLRASLVQSCVPEMDVVVHESIASTNDWALQQSKAGRGLPFACFAEEQLDGRGRRGKQWLMPACSNIAMSLAWPFVLPVQQMTLLPLSIALAIAETLEAVGLEQVQIKWPNDVYVRGKKIAGILIETQPVSGESGDRCLAVIIGVGLNFDMGSLSGEQRQSLPPFTDLCGECQHQSVAERASRADVAVMLLQHIVDLCGRFQHDAKRNLERFRSHYDFCRDKQIILRLDDGQRLEGTACGVNDDAELLVSVDGRECRFNSADVSVKAMSETIMSKKP